MNFDSQIYSTVCNTTRRLLDYFGIHVDLNREEIQRFAYIQYYISGLQKATVGKSLG
jgi:hypothetical protein